MSGYRLRLRTAPPRRIDLSSLQPAVIATLPHAEVERLAVAPGLAVADLFDVRADAGGELVIEGGSPFLDGVGAGMDGGELRLIGEAGAFAGRDMRAGTLIVDGPAGVSAAAGMRGGTLEIRGDAAEGLAAPTPDARNGMAGGFVVVRGNAGAGAGERQRRGVLIIEGNSGERTGARMIAGTLIVCGRAAAHFGVMMRRGTIVVGPGSETPPPGFVRTGNAPPVFLALLARYVLNGTCASTRARDLLARELERFAGDLASLGKGEVLACR